MSMPVLGYPLKPHWTQLKPPAPPGQCHWVALVDAGQVAGLDRQLSSRWLGAPTWALFEGTFAQTAIAYSPWVLSLSANDDARAEELGWLDAHCQHLPIVSVLALNVEPATWVTHLRRCLSMDLEDDGFLWRLADTQMLMAGLKAMNADQKAWVMQGCEHWWLAYADGTLADAKQGIDAIANQNETESLHLDALQSAVLLEEAAPSLLAAQLRSQAEGFGTACSHAQQILFATTCLNEARLDCIDEGAELLSFAVQRWTDQHAPDAQPD